MGIATAAEIRGMLTPGGETLTLEDATTPAVRWNGRPTAELEVADARHEAVGEVSDLASAAIGQTVTRDTTAVVYTVVERYEDGVGRTVLRLTPV